MEKLVLLSVLFVNVAIPARAASRAVDGADLRAALKRAVLQCAAFDLVYPFVLVYVVPRIF